MKEKKNKLMDKNEENEISKVKLNISDINNNIYSENNFNFNNQNKQSESFSINSKLFENEINNSQQYPINKRLKKHNIVSSNDILFSDSNLSSLNHSFQNLTKIEQKRGFNNKKKENLKLNQTISYLSNIEKNDYLYNKKEIYDKNPGSFTYYGTFNFKPSNLPNKVTDTDEDINKLYNYGESLTKELKSSNDKNSDLLMKYINLKAEIQIKENQNKELENKIQNLKKEQFNLNKSNQEFVQNISCVQKIVNNNKLSSLKSISESEKIINLNKRKINELNILNENLFNLQKQYGNEIDRLKNVLKNYKINDDDFEKLEKIFENENKENRINILDEIEKLKIKNSNLQKEINQLENENNFQIDKLNINLIKMKDISSMNEVSKEIEKQNEEYINEIKYLNKELNLKNMKLKESMKEINEMNKNIQILEDENYKKEEYLSLKKKNDENISKLNELDEEIKYLINNLNKMKKKNDEDLNKLNKIYILKTEDIIKENIENELKEILEENERIKNENNEIIKSLEDFPDLNNEYEELFQINLKLKQNL